jgi:hypothetical protein
LLELVVLQRERLFGVVNAKRTIASQFSCILRDTGGEFWEELRILKSPDPELPYLDGLEMIERDAAGAPGVAEIPWLTTYVVAWATDSLSKSERSRSGIFLWSLDGEIARRIDTDEEPGVARYDPEPELSGRMNIIACNDMTPVAHPGNGKECLMIPLGGAPPCRWSTPQHERTRRERVVSCAGQFAQRSPECPDGQLGRVFLLHAVPWTMVFARPLLPKSRFLTQAGIGLSRAGWRFRRLDRRRR